MISLLNERIFNGKPCYIVFHDPELFETLKNSSISGMNSLITKLEKSNGKPFPEDIDCIHLYKNYYRAKLDDARIMLKTYAAKSAVVTVWAGKRDEDTYDYVDTDKGRKILDARAERALEKYEDRVKQSVPDSPDDTPTKQNRYDVASVTPIDNYCLVMSFVEDKNHKKQDDVVCDLNSLIGNNAYLKNEAIFKTAKLDGDYVKWGSGTKISLYDIFTKCDIMSKEEYQNLLNERWRRRRGRYLLYR